MADIEIMALNATAKLREIAQQASRLGAGLQNAAPVDKDNSPNASIQYLLAITDELNKMAVECEKLGPKHTQ